MGEDRHALFPVTQSNDPIFYEEFDEVHYGLWAKVLTDAKQVDPVLEDLYLFYFREGE